MDFNAPVENPEVTRWRERAESYRLRVQVLENELEVFRERDRLVTDVVDIGYRVYLRLTGKEALILTCLMLHESCTKSKIMHFVYGGRLDADADIGPKIVDVFVHRLRQKLKKHGIEIETIRGVGYRLTPAQKQKVRDILATLREERG